MQVIMVDSRMIYAVRYDPVKRELEVFFHSGGVYRYRDVEPEVYERLLSAESKGRHMHDHVIGKFQDYQVSG